MVTAVSDKSVPDFRAACTHVLSELVLFTHSLRGEGAIVASNAVIDMALATAEVGLNNRRQLRAALKAAILNRHTDDAVFEDLFPIFWTRLRTGLRIATSGNDHSLPEYPSSAIASSDDDWEQTSQWDGVDRSTENRLSKRSGKSLQSSNENALRDSEKSTASFNSVGRGGQIDVETESVIDTIAINRFEREIANHSGRRWTRTGQGRHVALRRAIRTSFETGGIITSIPHQQRKETALQCCVLVDVSQSMLDVLDRTFLLTFLDRLHSDARSCRVFFFDTHIREVTKSFDRSDGNPEGELRNAEVEWGGGTRIGHALLTLRSNFPTVVGRRTPVIVISDGVDVGELEKLKQGMSWLSRQSSLVLWLNPLAHAEEYAPTVQGMSTALPYLDGLFAFTDTRDIAEIARQLRQYPSDYSIDFQHDFRVR